MSRWSCMLCYALGAMNIMFWFNKCSTVEVNKEYTIISADNLFFLSLQNKQQFWILHLQSHCMLHRTHILTYYQRNVVLYGNYCELIEKWRRKNQNLFRQCIWYVCCIYCRLFKMIFFSSPWNPLHSTVSICSKFLISINFIWMQQSSKFRKSFLGILFPWLSDSLTISRISAWPASNDYKLIIGVRVWVH